MHKSTIMEEMISKMFDIPTTKALQIWQKYKPNLLTGTITSHEFLNKVKLDLHSEKSVEKLVRIWRRHYRSEAEEVDWELLTLIEKLKEKYKVYLFTDTIDIHDEYNSRRGIYDKFDKVYKSYKERVAKAQGEKAFLNLLKEIKAQPNECVFIDDLERNVKIAEKLGIKSILYKNLHQLKISLPESNIY